MVESDVEKKLCQRVKSDLDGMALKFISPGLNGVPDRIILLPGARAVFVETKAPGKKLRALQRYVCGLIRRHGFDVLRIDDFDKIDAFIQWEKQRVGQDGV